MPLPPQKKPVAGHLLSLPPKSWHRTSAYCSLLSSPFDVLQGFPGSIGPPGENGPEGIKVRGAAKEWLLGLGRQLQKERGKGNGKGRDRENPGDLRRSFWPECRLSNFIWIVTAPRMGVSVSFLGGGLLFSPLPLLSATEIDIGRRPIAAHAGNVLLLRVS